MRKSGGRYSLLNEAGIGCSERTIAMSRTTAVVGMAAAALVAVGAAAGEEGFVVLFDGKDLSAWKTPGDIAEHWKVRDGIIDYGGGCKGKVKDLWTKKSYKDFVLKLDWRFPKRDKPNMRMMPEVLPDGSNAVDKEGKPKFVLFDYAGDSGVYVRGNSKSQINIWNWPIGSGEVYGYRMDKSMPPVVRAGVTPKMNADNAVGQWNAFEIMMKGDRLTVAVNGKKVIDNAQLPGVPKSGPIALQHHGDPIQFRNVSIKELK